MGEAARRSEGRRLHAVDGGAGPSTGAGESGESGASVMPGAPEPPDDSPVLAPGHLPTFGEGYRAWRAEMVRLAYLVTGSDEVAHDVVQDAFVQLHGRWGSLHDPHAYLRRTVVNGCRSQQRRAVRQRRAVTRLAGRPVQDAALGADELSDTLLRLGHRQRAALVLRFYGGLADADIATALGCRPGTVASLVHRGLAQLRTEIER